MGIHKYSSGEAGSVGLGQTGNDVISDTSAHAGKIVAITFLSDSVFTDLTPESALWAEDPSETFPQGVTIVGRWTTLTLASGSAIIYYG
jgi:hypothetical protein